MLKKDAIDYFGSVSALADALGITSQAVSMWPDVVPVSRQWQLEIKTGGKLKADTDKAMPDRAVAPRA